MSRSEVIRAWRDEEYRLSLSEAERAELPAHPAGLIELQDADLEGVAGARGTHQCSIRSVCVQVQCYSRPGSTCPVPTFPCQPRSIIVICRPHRGGGMVGR